MLYTSSAEPQLICHTHAQLGGVRRLQTAYLEPSGIAVQTTSCSSLGIIGACILGPLGHLTI